MEELMNNEVMLMWELLDFSIRIREKEVIVIKDYNTENEMRVVIKKNGFEASKNGNQKVELKKLEIQAIHNTIKYLNEV